MEGLGEARVEEIELLFRKVTRGTLPQDGDILFRLDGRWIFSRLGFQATASGIYSFPVAQINGGKKQQFTIKNSDTEGIKATDIILVSGSENKNPVMLTQAKGDTDQFELFIENTDTGNQNTTSDGKAGDGRFIAFRILA